MAYDFRRVCKVQSKRFMWIMALILASVVLVQYFELPYRNSLLSLISTGKSYFQFSDAAEKHSFLGNNNPRPPVPVVDGSISPENTSANRYMSKRNRSSIGATISIAPISPVQYNYSIGAISPSIEEISPSRSPEESAISISDMNEMLLRDRSSLVSTTPNWPSAADEEMLDSRFEIEHTKIIKDYPTLYAPIYRNLSTFTRSYEIMEKNLKIYIYPDGEGPVFHQKKLIGIYASEGWFIKLLESSTQFITSNPKEAHLFYLPFSSVMLVKYIYVKDSNTYDDINAYLKNYLDAIKIKYPFWNRTDGADHFVVACHDWGPIETRKLMGNCIRGLCNSNVKQGFELARDVSIAQAKIHSPENPVEDMGGLPPLERKYLAFFAGKMHGKLRPILLKYWENKDPEMMILGRMRHGYTQQMKNTKYCICAKGFAVNSPRVVEAIMFGCVPVIISDNYVPPFFEMLNWELFAVFVLEKDIPNLKDILLSISKERYLEMHKSVEQVRQHFLWHKTPVKYDVFHMILHSIWYKRVFQLKPR